MITDILKREMKVGDIVVATNISTVCQQLHVVTRLGSKDMVQLNGNSYATADYLMICTEQYAHQYGKEATEAFIEKYREVFQYEAVEKKQGSPRFLIYRIGSYKTYKDGKVVGPDDERFFVIQVQGNQQEQYQQVNAFIKQQNIGLKYPNTRTLVFHKGQLYHPKGYYWCYSSVKDAVSKKVLLSWGFSEKNINKEIVNPIVVKRLKTYQEN